MKQFLFVAGFFTGVLMAMSVLLSLHSDEKTHSVWRGTPRVGDGSPRFIPRVPRHTATARGGLPVSFNVLLTPSVPKFVLERTWASRDKHVHYFMTIYENTSMTAGDESVTVLQSDLGYPLLALMKVLCERKLSEVQWHVVSHGSTYIKTREVASFLRRMFSTDALLLGHCQRHSWENPSASVLSEMGFIVSQGLMESFCPSLWQCEKELTLRLPHVELGRCIRAVTGIHCSDVSDMLFVILVTFHFSATKELKIAMHELYIH